MKRKLLLSGMTALLLSFGLVLLACDTGDSGKTTYTVTFNGNGGSTPSSQTVNAGSSTTLPSTNRSGYTFNGWYASSSGGTSVGSSGSAYTPSSNVTLYAQWTPTYTVTFNGNGGTSPSSQTVNADSSTTLPSTTRSGYTLNGWYTSSSGGTKAGNAGDSYTPSASVTLYAQWTQDAGGGGTTYTVTFDGNGGSSPSSQTVNAGSSTTLPSTTQSGYTLNGWYTSSSGGTKAGNAGDSYTPSASVTLYAQWTQGAGGGGTTYTVTFNGNGGSSPSSQTVNAGSSTTLPSTTQSGYTLNGWYTSSSGGTKAGNAGDSYTPSASITLYAQWTQGAGGGGTTYTVTFNGNGGTSPSSQTVNAGSSTTLPSTTQSGYTLNGWYTSSSGGTKAGDAGVTYTPTSNITLYAQWTQDEGGGVTTYTVTFNGNGGTSPSSQTVNAGSSTTLPSITRSDYTLNGWYTSSSGGTKVGDAGATYTPTSDITLYAQWTQSIAIPTGVSATAQSSSSIRVSWSASSSGGTPAWYNIWRSTSAYGTYTEIGYVSGSTTSYTNTGLDASTTYYYKVDAETNSNIRSAQSSYASATTQSSSSGTTTTTPGTPTISGSRSGSNITLSWSFPTGDGNGPPTSIVIRVREPSTGDIHNIATLSGTATQYSFPYLPYVDDGSVMMGIMGTNEYGSTTSRTLVYMTNTNTWY